jgi:type IV pilus assembly protein PilQ
MTAMKQLGDCKGLQRALASATATLALFLISAAAMAENVLQDVRYAAAPGGKVDITLQFSGPVGEVQAFTTDSPPRIAIDLPGTTNGLSSRRVAIGSGATSAVSAAEAGGRTRVVVDLFRPAGYTTRSAGNTLALTVDGGSSATAAAGAMASAADPSKRVASGVSVSNIDFRRGENGSGRVILRFNSDQAAADMRNEGSKVVIDVSNASIPENLRRRLDVSDFATPVVSLEPNANAGGTRLVVNTSGEFETMAYQTGMEYVVEIAPKRGAVIAAAPAARRSATPASP